ncbi:hypothetical protein CFC21_039155 [Triticum aestivum]|uniref:Dirigent protein n=3 Tax=Triticum TaxID=4564 RepID=A0A9R1FEP4_WHEAT|nr:pterocarpan synthase 1-like [Triticum aestivum]KAF7027083.1 hypothetical protein CFC21_039155 [Triticum aestivum]CDM80547.1 unnamed protein product [Triticum aestivum]VAH71249.1 unnamed protein product [Triticum turgidum subsp. durum]
MRPMASSWNWKLLSLVFLLASTAAWGMAHAHGGGLKHIHLYMHETFTGPNATLFAVVPPLLGVGDNTSMFGMVGVLDDELRDGSDPSNSSLVGRFQSLFAFAGLVTPPGMQTATSLVFTAGEHAGSTLVMVGSIVSSEGPYETAVVGGTGAFRMARGYCVLKAVWSPTPVSTVYEVNLLVKMEGKLLAKMDAWKRTTYAL